MYKECTEPVSRVVGEVEARRGHNEVCTYNIDSSVSGDGDDRVKGTEINA